MSPTLSHESRVMFVELLAREKEDTRGWLRTEMDRLVDPLVNSMFNRLETKLTNGIERTQSGDAGDCGQLMNSIFVDQSANLITHPSTSLLPSLIPTYFNRHNSNINYSNSIPIDPRSTSQSSFLSPVPSLPVSVLNDQITLPNELTVQSELTNVQSQIPKPIKHEIEPNNANEPFRSDQSQQSLPASIVNEQLNQNLANWIDEDEDEEDCDCDDCVYGGIGVKEEDEDSDSVKLIEDDQGVEESSSSRPAKIPRLDHSTQSNISSLAVMGRLFQTRQSPTDEVTQQPNPSINNQIITVHLKCPLSDNCHCPDTFPEEQKLNQHMLDVH